jgi:hypothetical protein
MSSSETTVMGGPPNSVYVSRPFIPFTVGIGKPALVDGVAVHKYGATPEIKALADRLKTAGGDNQVVFGAYSLEPAKLQKLLSKSATAKPFLFDAALTIEKDDDSKLWRSTKKAGKSVKEIERSAVFASMLKELELPEVLDPSGAETPDSIRSRKVAENDLRTVVASFLHDPAAKVYVADWNNQDDTDIYGVVAVNAKMGVMNVAKIFPAI